MTKQAIQTSEVGNQLLVDNKREMKPVSLDDIIEAQLDENSTMDKRLFKIKNICGDTSVDREVGQNMDPADTYQLVRVKKIQYL